MATLTESTPINLAKMSHPKPVEPLKHLNLDAINTCVGTTMTGKEFNTLVLPLTQQLYKLLNADLVQLGFQYKVGLNTLIEPFNGTGTCSAGGLYTTGSQTVHRWIVNLKTKTVYPLIARAYIPDTAQVYIESNSKFKSDALILEEPIYIEDYIVNVDAQHNYYVWKQYVDHLGADGRDRINRKIGTLDSLLKLENPDVVDWYNYSHLEYMGISRVPADVQAIIEDWRQVNQTKQCTITEYCVERDIKLATR